MRRARRASFSLLESILRAIMVCAICAPMNGSGEDCRPCSSNGPSGSVTDTFLSDHAARGSVSFAVVEFGTLLSPVQRALLERRGVKVLKHLCGTAYRVEIGKAVRTIPSGIAGLSEPLTVCDPAHERKMHPALLSGDYKAFVTRTGDGKLLNYAKNQDGSLNLVVSLYPGAQRAGLEDLLRAQGVPVIHGSVRLIGSDAVMLRLSSGFSLDHLRALARLNAVAWVQPGPPPIMPDMDTVREYTGVDVIQSFGTAGGLRGRDVVVGVFDKGIDEDSQDLLEADGCASGCASRVVDAPERSNHGTRVAGIVGGNGKMSLANGGTANQWRGVAPSSRLLEVFVDTSDLEGSVNDTALWEGLIQMQGMHLSNHSYGWWSGDGNYSIHDQFRDEIVHGNVTDSGGGFIASRLQVCSSGNFGNINGYFGMNKQLKNSLVIGNLKHADDRSYVDTALGPATDGRVKPDVLAPGTDVTALSYCENGSDEDTAGLCDGFTTRHDIYGSMTGSSFASPVVTGGLSLALEAYFLSASSSGAEPPLPSTLRGAVIHGARDALSLVDWHTNSEGPVRPTPGPDFVSGFGIVHLDNTIAVLRDGLFREASLSQTGDHRRYKFLVTETRPIKVTLAWDDAAAAPGIEESLLVNDLDIVLISPSNQKWYPWQLDQSIEDPTTGDVIPDDQQTPGTSIKVTRQVLPAGAVDPGGVELDSDLIPNPMPEATRGRDHLNNVEMVEVPEGEAEVGVWTVEVSGFAVPEGPQSFTLLGETFLPTALFFDNEALCRNAFPLCRRLGIELVCRRLPELCGAVPIWVSGTGFQISFRAPEEKIVIRVEDACVAVMKEASALCKERRIRVKSLPSHMGVIIAREQGRHRSYLSGNDQRWEPVSPRDDYLVFYTLPEATSIGSEPITLQFK